MTGVTFTVEKGYGESGDEFTAAGVGTLVVVGITAGVGLVMATLSNPKAVARAVSEGAKTYGAEKERQRREQEAFEARTRKNTREKYANPEYDEGVERSKRAGSGDDSTHSGGREPSDTRQESQGGAGSRSGDSAGAGSRTTDRGDSSGRGESGSGRNVDGADHPDDPAGGRGGAGRGGSTERGGTTGRGGGDDEASSAGTIEWHHFHAHYDTEWTFWFRKKALAIDLAETKRENLAYERCRQDDGKWAHEYQREGRLLCKQGGSEGKEWRCRMKEVVALCKRRMEP